MRNIFAARTRLLFLLPALMAAVFAVSRDSLFAETRQVHTIRIDNEIIHTEIARRICLAMAPNRKGLEEGNILKWRNDTPFGNILDGAIRSIAMMEPALYTCF